jgi:hypothetical protein
VAIVIRPRHLIHCLPPHPRLLEQLDVGPREGAGEGDMDDDIVFRRSSVHSDGGSDFPVELDIPLNEVPLTVDDGKR